MMCHDAEMIALDQTDGADLQRLLTALRRDTSLQVV